MTQSPDIEPTVLDDDIQIDLGVDEDLSSSDDVEINLDFGADDDDEPEPAGVDLNFDDEPEADEDDSDEDESDPTLEAALAELRADLASKFGDWYVVHTYSGMENRVKQNLDARVQTLNMEDYIFESVVPTEEVVEIRNGARKTVTRTVLPGYVLVRMELTEESWAAVRHTPSVTGFVGHANQPVPLSLEEVEKMMTPAVIAKTAAASTTPTTRTRKKAEVIDFAIGDSVQVVDGPFAGVHATITEINVNTQRLKALVEILGRETPVDLTFPQIQKV